MRSSCLSGVYRLMPTARYAIRTWGMSIFGSIGQKRDGGRAMRQQVALLPYEADGHFALGVALPRQGAE